VATNNRDGEAKVQKPHSWEHNHMEKPLDERKAGLKAELRRLKEQRKVSKEDMKRLKKKIKELKDSKLNHPQAQDDDQDDEKDDED
jgi:phage shock protein A